MSKFDLSYNLLAFQELDRFALLASQDYNLGNEANWFLTFRGGLHGFFARLYGTKIHYDHVHRWIAAFIGSMQTQ